MSKTTTRNDIAARKEALANELRAIKEAAVPALDDQMISVRELSAKYGLALRTVSLELQKLADEGVLYTVPRVGTFIGRPDAARSDVFIAIFPYLRNETGQLPALRAGFEERIARLGGTSLVMDYETAQRYYSDEKRLQPAGVFEIPRDLQPTVWAAPSVPHIEFGRLSDDKPRSNMVYFDNVRGGRAAAQHLMALKHRRIAFLGVHAEHGEIGIFHWSKEREDGWRQCMVEAKQDVSGLAFHPAHTPEVFPAAQKAAALESAHDLLGREDVTAVVVVNAIAAQALLQALRETRRPVGNWPAIVSFDSEAESNDKALSAVTALRLPWEEIGREAANVLWDRAQGRLTGPPEQRLVPMSLIPRFSCRRDWQRVPMATLYQNTEAASIAG